MNYAKRWFALSVTSCLVAMATASAPAFASADSNLLVAAYEGDLDRVRALVRSHTALDAVDENGYTALHWAAYNGNAELAQILVAAGASLDVQNDQGCTPLMIAAFRKSPAVVRILVVAGASQAVKSKEDFDVRDYANEDANVLAALSAPRQSTRPILAAPPKTGPRYLVGEELATYRSLSERLEAYRRLPAVEQKNPWIAALLNAVVPGVGTAYAGLGDQAIPTFQLAILADGLVLGGIYFGQAILSPKVAPSLDSMLVPGAIGIGATHLVLGGLMGAAAPGMATRRELERRAEGTTSTAGQLDRLEKLDASRGKIWDEVHQKMAAGDSQAALASLLRLSGPYSHEEVVRELRKDLERQVRLAREEKARRAAEAAAAEAAERERRALAEKQANEKRAREHQKTVVAAKNGLFAAIAAGNKQAALTNLATYNQEAQSGMVGGRGFLLSECKEKLEKGTVRSGESLLLAVTVQQVVPGGALVIVDDPLGGVLDTLFRAHGVPTADHTLQLFVQGGVPGAIDRNKALIGVKEAGTYSFRAVNGATVTVRKVKSMIRLE